jgi:hypothetical protein
MERFKGNFSIGNLIKFVFGRYNTKKDATEIQAWFKVCYNHGTLIGS